ncbi:MAG TPA: hypothetical protein VHK69_14225 [Chitinophagaceae bacterium]|jgi:Pyruvate/2-oxoacid:ferredoxin oxidoreductase gamma subunit|nr:hypothetical protein [Chitinophagaceae bacterium]
MKKKAKKKAKKRAMSSMALVAFALQVAEFGLQLWKKSRKRKGKAKSGQLTAAI